MHNAFTSLLTELEVQTQTTNILKTFSNYYDPHAQIQKGVVGVVADPDLLEDTSGYRFHIWNKQMDPLPGLKKQTKQNPLTMGPGSVAIKFAILTVSAISVQPDLGCTLWINFDNVRWHYIT